MLIFAPFPPKHKDLTDLPRYYKYVELSCSSNSSFLNAELTPRSLYFHARFQEKTNVECCSLKFDTTLLPCALACSPGEQVQLTLPVETFLTHLLPVLMVYSHLQRLQIAPKFIPNQ